MFRPYQQEQMFLLPPTLQDFIPEGHPVHMINDLVEKLDLAVLYGRYGAIGQPAYEPRLMLKAILYGFTVGVFSARKLTRACTENMAFQYLVGLEKPSFKTFIEFRQRHRDDMREVFVQTAKLARALGLARLGSVALDGTKVTANTSKHKAMSYGRMQEEEKRLKAEIEKLLKQAEDMDAEEDRAFGTEKDGYSLEAELARRSSRLKKIEEAKAALEKREKESQPEEAIDPKKQISFADMDARCFAKKSDGARYVYNAQAAVDMGSQVILENHIEDSVSDAGAAGTVLQTMRETLGETPEALVADAGYANQATLKACLAEGVRAVCSPSKEGKESSEEKSGGLESLSYDAERNEFRCAHGSVYVFDRTDLVGGATVYRSVAETPCGCGRAKKSGESILRVRASHLARRELSRILSQPENQTLYRRRKCTVEPVFGQIKCGMGFQRFLYRGRKNVGSEWNTVCAAFNLKKMAALLKVKACRSNGGVPPPRMSRAENSVAGVINRFSVHWVHLFRSLFSLSNVWSAPVAQPG